MYMGALRQRISGHWEQGPMISSKGNLTSHIKLNNDILKSVPVLKEEQDSITTSLNIDTNFSVEIHIETSTRNYQRMIK